MIEDTLGRVSAGEDLSMETMANTIDLIMRGECTEAEIATLLTSLRHKGETVEEIAGAADAMRKHMTKIASPHDLFIDTCGTGGDGSNTFNISTAAALVAAAAGVPVAKHGNRGVSSKSGSANVLAELGVNIEADLAQVERCLAELGICFCFAPLMHGAMKHVAAVRKKLGVPTIFNMLGPLANPASAPRQLLGVGRPELRGKLAAALAMLGTERSLVVSGEDGLDEVTLTGATNISEVTSDGIREFRWTPEDFGISPAPLDSMKIDGPVESAAVIQDVLSGTRNPARDIVVLNAAAALFVAGKHGNPQDCAAAVSEAIDSGQAKTLLSRLAEVSRA